MSTVKAVNKRKDFTEGGLFFRIILFTLPIIMTGVLQVLYNMADSAIVGKFSDDSLALASVASTSTLYNCIVNLLFGFSGGAAVIVAQFFGGKNYDGVSRAVHTSMLFSVIGGVVISLFTILISVPALTLLGTKAELMSRATLYLRIIALGIPASAIYNFGASILRSVGNSKTPLIILASAGVMNVLLNLFFVIVLNMAADGVAIATVISQYFSAAGVLFVLKMSRGESYALFFSKLRINAAILKKMILFGLPSGIQGSLMSISNMFLTYAYNSLPTYTITAIAITNNIDGVTYTSMNSFSVAALTFVGQNYGAGKYDRIKKTIFYTLIHVTVVGVLISQTELLLDNVLINMFIKQTDENYAIVVETAKLIMKKILTLYFMCGIMEVLSGSIRGLGHSLEPMVISIFSAIFVRGLFALVLFPMEQFNNLSFLLTSFPTTWISSTVCQIVVILIVMRSVKKRIFSNSSLLQREKI